MNKDKSELDAFMGELAGQNNVDPLEQKQEDPFNHLEKKEEVEVKDEKEEKSLPFNKDPKIQKYLDKREREIEERMLKKFDNKDTTRETQPVADERMNEVLTRIIGNDTPEKVQGVKDMKELLVGLKGEARAEALAEIRSMQEAEVVAEKQAEEELETAFDNIEEIFDVDITSNNPIARKTRQEFVAYIERIAPKDENGEIKDFPDMNAAWEDFSEKKKLTSPVNRAKDLASRSMARSAEANSEPVLKRGRTPFSNSDDFIESLSK